MPRLQWVCLQCTEAESRRLLEVRRTAVPQNYCSRVRHICGFAVVCRRTRSSRFNCTATLNLLPMAVGVFRETIRQMPSLHSTEAKRSTLRLHGPIAAQESGCGRGGAASPTRSGRLQRGRASFRAGDRANPHLLACCSARLYPRAMVHTQERLRLH